MQQRYLVGTLFDQEQLNKKMNGNNVKLKDPMGNVRWKGAFTGGFQAGFKNTCGSKQGWTPSTFYSTIGGARGDRKQQSIFDFMDKEDLGRQSIGQNISTHNKFLPIQTNPLNICMADSAGQRIIEAMKKKSALAKAPQDISELQKLLQNYKQQQLLTQENQKYVLQGVEGHNSVGSNSENIPDDDMIVAYEDFFRRVIRAGFQNETQQEKAKRREQNKIYFDFTRPLQSQPQYLKQIQQVEQFGKPKRKRKNVINDRNLKDLFRLGTVQFHSKLKEDIKLSVPQDYDPCHRIKQMREKQKQLIVAIQNKKSHRVYDVNQRSDIFNAGKLGSRFVSAAGTNPLTKFMRTNQQQKVKELEKVFEDGEKNKRYWDYVLELEGKKISAQLQYLSYEQAEKEKQEFEKIYKIKNRSQTQRLQQLPKKVEEAIELKNKKQIVVKRKTGFWRPQRLLCKRFGCMLPYKEQISSKQRLS